MAGFGPHTNSVCTVSQPRITDSFRSLLKHKTQENMWQFDKKRAPLKS